MDIVKLAPGERAPEDSDCISIQEGADGRFLLNASALITCVQDGDEEEEGDSAAVIGGSAYASYDEAEAAGLAWAADQCVEFLYVARSAGTTPLPE
jgi:hypothetical protein